MAVRLYSYNILADDYIRRSYYPHSSDAALEPVWRLRALCDRVAALEADVLCLQEVQRQALEALTSRLDSYQMFWAPKGRGRPDGCATFVHADRLVASRQQRLAYGDGTGHVALLTWIQLEGVEVAIANTHLRWSPPKVPVSKSFGYLQLEELASHIDSDRWVVCGDFNLGPEHKALELLGNRGLRDVYAESGPGFTCNSNGEAKRIDFIFAGAGLTAEPLPIATIEDQTPLPSELEPSDHLPIGADLDLAP